MFRFFFLRWGLFFNFDRPFVSHPGEFDPKMSIFVKSPPLPAIPPPPRHGVYIDRCITFLLNGTSVPYRDRQIETRDHLPRRSRVNSYEGISMTKFNNLKNAEQKDISLKGRRLPRGLNSRCLLGTPHREFDQHDR